MIRDPGKIKKVGIRVQQENFYEEIGFQLVGIGDKGQQLVAVDVEFEERDVGKVYGATALLQCATLIDQAKGGDSAAQALMNDLWRIGVRPTEAKAGSELIESLNYHLEDMRSIVFGPGSPLNSDRIVIGSDEAAGKAKI